MSNNKEIYHFNKDLPAKGWLHSCLLCYSVTGKYIPYKYTENDSSFNFGFGFLKKKEKTYDVFLCNKCCKEIKQKTETNEKYERKVIKHITKYG